MARIVVTTVTNEAIGVEGGERWNVTGEREGRCAAGCRDWRHVLKLHREGPIDGGEWLACLECLLENHEEGSLTLTIE